MKTTIFDFLWTGLLVFTIPLLTNGQNRKNDSVKPASPVTFVFTESGVNGPNPKHFLSETIDSNLDNFTNYIPWYNLGNTGLPYVPLTFDYNDNTEGFFYGYDFISRFFYSDSSILYYNTRAPITEFYYVTDPQIHQYFRFVHSENIGKKLNFALGFKRIRSVGFYANQSTNENQLSLSINYHNKRYLLLSDAIYNVYNFNQNGGVTQDSNLSNPEYSNRQTMPINLPYAQTTIRESSFHLKQYYFLNYNKGDSLKEHPHLYLSHSLRLATHSNIFQDAASDSTFYAHHSHQDSVNTYDSVHYYEVSNDLSIGSFGNKKNTIQWDVGVKNQIIHFADGRTDSLLTNFIAHAGISNYSSLAHCLFKVDGWDIFTGNQKGDNHADGSFGYRFDSLNLFTLSSSYSYQTPPLIFDLFNGDNSSWINHFSRITTRTFFMNYDNLKWHLYLSVGLIQTSNLVYFGYDTLPAQYPHRVNIKELCITKEFRLGKWHWNAIELFQAVSDSLPIRLPEFVLENSVFYENQLFHRHLLLRIGVDIFYSSSYYSDAYMPEFDQYFLQHYEKTGNYTYFNPFFSFRIKTFRMFVKYENVGAGILPGNYLYAPHYPVTDREIRFGVLWDFWN